MIEALQQFDPNDEVIFAYPSGDYWQTTVAAEIDYVEHQRVVRSSYHDTWKVVDDDHEDDGGHPDDASVERVVIR